MLIGLVVERQVFMSPQVHVACLCAAWCRICEAYAAVFDEVRPGWADPGPRIAWHWPPAARSTAASKPMK